MRKISSANTRAAPWNWNLFHSPFTFVAALIFYVSALAEANRTPFDIPEAESELVAGFATEYSGMRFALFFLAEWGTLYVIGAVMTTLFLGGWHVPIWTDNVVLLNISQFIVFFLKSYFWDWSILFDPDDLSLQSFIFGLASDPVRSSFRVPGA